MRTDTYIPTNTRQPVLFLGHGSPMVTLQDNRFTRAWREVGRSIARPRAVLMISAHWYTRGTAIATTAAPATLHDFYGFPPELYAMRYPAPGDPALARRVTELLTPLEVLQDGEWGLDHGAWCVLTHVFPDADIPVVQLSIDSTQPNAWHYALGRRLAPLRDEGVLIVGSGNVVHHLGALRREANAAPWPWATEFSRIVREHVARGDHAGLVDYERFAECARQSVPSPDHYLPLLYVLGASTAQDTVSVFTEGIELGSIDMMSVQLG